MNGTSLAPGSVVGPGASEMVELMGVETGVNNKWRLGGFWKVTEGGLLTISWVDGPEARIISSGKR